MTKRAYLLHALSPLHAGIGQAADLIDMPIARMKGTNIPFVPSSSIKGVLRDAASASLQQPEIKAMFGPDRATENPNEHAGALICTDARLLALPVRSFKGTFAYVTSPLLLVLAARDLATPPSVPSVQSHEIVASPSLIAADKVYLEDLDLTPKNPDQAYTDWCNILAKAFSPPGIFKTRFAIVHDDTMTFLWETATQLDRRVSIDQRIGVARDGALWLEESLPPETLLIGVLLADTPRWNGMNPNTAQEVLNKAVSLSTTTLQFGGKSTVGRGRCRMIML